MKPFTILDRTLNINRHYILEASAGTGKTFSIENLFTRLLLESNPANCIDQILVVTFTRAATSELKTRIRSQLVKAVDYFNHLMASREFVGFVPDYLTAYRERSSDVVEDAKKRLDNALICFDEARILTIHGFCQSMLSEYLFECNLGSDAGGANELLSTDQMIQVIRDFFRTMLKPDLYSPGQLKIVLKSHRQEIQSLERTLTRIISQGIPIVSSPSFAELLQQFKQAMRSIRDQYVFSSQDIIEDFILQASSYKGACNKQNEIHPELLKKVTRFASYFDQGEWSAADFDALISDQLMFLNVLHSDKLKSKAALHTDKLKLPEFQKVIKKTLEPLVQKAGNEKLIIARMAFDCQQMLEKHLQEEERFRYDDLLKAMRQAIRNPRFAQKLRDQFKAVIIDEFQDTDILQWEIFDGLFLSNSSKTLVYLVGDPKQSIYGFRHADIYTYLKASQKLGEEHRASLNTNYRSQPSLVKALNTLFSSESFPQLLNLPRLGKALEYREVQASEYIQSRQFSDNWGNVHFFIGTGKQGRSDRWPTQEMEETTFFPFIAHEILKLHDKDKVKFSDWALLVSDRYQGERLANFLKRWNIPVVTQRQEMLTDSLVWSAFRDLLFAILHPHDASAFKQALGGCLIGLTHHHLRELLTIDEQAKIYNILYTLREVLYREGFDPFFQTLMQTTWTSNGLSLSEQILKQKSGLKMHQELQQLGSLLSEYQNKIQATPYALLDFLEEGKALEIYEEEQLKVKQDATCEAVKILTLHTSKGLEFNIVVPIGLICRTLKKENLIPIEQEGERRLMAFMDEDDPAVQEHLHELDAEKVRQLYVAFTRAKYRLYVPIALTEDASRDVATGEASSMELYLSHLKTSSQQDQSIKFFLDWLDEKGKVNSITYAHLHANEKGVEFPINQEEIPPLVQPRTVKIPGKSLFSVSFSTLASSMDQEALRSRPLLLKNEERSIHTLPMGQETGTLIHRILEEIPFHLLQQVQYPTDLTHDLVLFLRGTLLEGWEDVLSEMIYHLFTTPIQVGEDRFRLLDLNPQTIYREMEFLFPCDDFNIPALEDWQEFQVSQGMLKGVIDLIFEWNNKYYIVDWKSNWLGHDTEAYGQQALQAAIAEHHYDLQASIYTEALKRYLSLVDTRSFKSCFGGALYLFLRGIHPDAKPNQGVFSLCVD